MIDPHCIVWVKALASLWGVVGDIGDPVALTNPVPIRLRVDGDSLVSDRELRYKWDIPHTVSRVALRCYFKHEKFIEITVEGVGTIGAGATDVNVRVP